MNKVCIAISTFGNRVNSIKIPDFVSGVCYLIVHQGASNVLLSDKLNLLIRRCDVTYCRLNNVGLSRSRNFALSVARSNYIHIMDDDVDINPLEIKKMVDLATLERTDISLGRFIYENGNLSKSRSCKGDVRIDNFFSVCSIEMCIGKKVIDEGVFFDENFGLGTKNPSGEELLFLCGARKKNLAIRYYPLCIGTHPDVTSGFDFFSTEEKIRAKKNMFRTAFPVFFLFFMVLFFFKKIPCLAKSKRTLFFLKNFFF